MVLSLGRFKDDESGSAAVELAVWMPFFWLVFGLIVDVTMLFKYQTQFVDVAREASRQVSIDRMTQQEAYTFLVSRFSSIDGIEAEVFVDANSVTTSITAPMSSLTVLSSAFIGNSNVNGKISMFMEEAVANITPAEGA